MAKGTQVGVFFDGTGNCRDNDIDKGCETNVAKLFELYDKSNSNNFINNHAFYIRGVGSELGEFIVGGFSGIGGLERIEIMLADVQDYFNTDKVRDLSPKVIDVCGFSRGASQARHFVNCIKYEGLIDERTGEPFDDIEIRFMGLFDTVASFGVPGNSIDPGFDFDVDPKIIGKAVHFVAEHEKRSMFDLESIKSSANEVLDEHKMVEASFPGAHSDVGGGYTHQEARAERIIKRRGNNRLRISAIPEKLNDLSRIPLRAMHQFMLDANVPLAPLSAYPRPKMVEITPEVEAFYQENDHGTAFDDIIKSKYVHDSRFFFDAMRTTVFDSNEERTIHYPKPNPDFWKHRAEMEQEQDDDDQLKS